MSGFRLVLDPTACDGHGVCAELLPEGLSLDDWGYPVLAASGRPAGRPGDLPAGLLAHARRAVSACPDLALRLVRTEDADGRTTRQ